MYCDKKNVRIFVRSGMYLEKQRHLTAHLIATTEVFIYIILLFLYIQLFLYMLWDFQTNLQYRR